MLAPIYGNMDKRSNFADAKINHQYDYAPVRCHQFTIMEEDSYADNQPDSE
jgi:hypothetical protein